MDRRKQREEDSTTESFKELRRIFQEKMKEENVTYEDILKSMEDFKK